MLSCRLWTRELPARRDRWIACLVLLGGLIGAPAVAQEPNWQEIPLEQALSEAAAANAIVMVEFWAPHCHTCGDMDEQVWETPAGVELTEKTVALKIESTSAEGQTASAQYPLTALPTVLFLRGDGSEIDRVEGYEGPDWFFERAQQPAEGVDPLPGVEAQLEEQPSSLPLLMEVMERYLNRGREAEADSLLERILAADPQNRQRFAEKAIPRAAKHYEYFRKDYDKGGALWKRLVDDFPYASSAGYAADRTYKAWTSLGRSADYVPWICGVLSGPGQSAAMLHQSVVRNAVRNGLRGECLADAARRTAELGRGTPAEMDSVAAILAGAR